MHNELGNQLFLCTKIFDTQDLMAPPHKYLSCGFNVSHWALIVYHMLSRYKYGHHRMTVHHDNYFL